MGFVTPVLSGRILLLLLCVIVTACANPQRDRYEATLAEIERQEQQLIEQSQRNRLASDASPDTQALDVPASAADPTKSNRQSETSTFLSTAAISSEISAHPQGSQASTPWWVERENGTQSALSECLVISQPIRTLGSSETPAIQLVLSDKVVYLRSSALIDQNAAQSALRIDTGLPFAFERYLTDSLAVIEAQYTTVLNELLSGSFVSASTVFDVSTGVPNLQILEISLKGFIEAYAQIDDC